MIVPKILPYVFERLLEISSRVPFGMSFQGFLWFSIRVRPGFFEFVSMFLCVAPEIFTVDFSSFLSEFLL